MAKPDGRARESLDARVAVQIRLALGPAGGADHPLEAQARALGLTGAEIDAARTGRCFDVQAGAAVAYALALRDPDQANLQVAQDRALWFGLPLDGLTQIQAIAEVKTSCRSQPDGQRD